MNSSFTRSFTQLQQRADQLLATVGRLPVARGETFRELAELGQTLEDAPVKARVVARMTVTREVGCKTIVEVEEGCSFHSFYRIYVQQGTRRSTKRLVRMANRNEGVQAYAAHLVRPGLELLAARWSKQPGVVSVKVRVIRRRAYRQLITASPDQLSLTKTSVYLPWRRNSTVEVSQ